MNNQEKLFRRLEESGYLPGAFVKTRYLLKGLMEYQKEERAGEILDILIQCRNERDYRYRLEARFPEYM